jgi:uncharacterized repeat protein (TIGR01451 family)
MAKLIKNIQRKSRFFKAMLFIYTILLFGAVLLVQTKVLQANEPVFAQVGNNCCNQSDWNACNSDYEWEQGYFACQQGHCGICQTQSTPNNGVCEPGENEVTHPNDCGGGGTNPNPGGGNDGGGNNGGTRSTIGGPGGDSRLYEIRQGWNYSSSAVVYYCPGQTSFGGGCSTFQRYQNDLSIPSGNTCGVTQIDYLCDSESNLVTPIPQAGTVGLFVCFKSQLNTTGCATPPSTPVNPTPVNPPVAQEPPQQEQPITVACNDTCNSTDRLCPANLVCHNTGSGNRCRLPANLSSSTCQPAQQQQNPGLDVIKVMRNGDNSYIVGELVPFEVRITNTGDTTLTTVSFTDTYDDQLDFVSIRGRRGSGAFVNLSGQAGVSIDESNRTITINNLAAILGNLAPGQVYTLEVDFLAEVPISLTCNVATAVSGNLNDTDPECVSITEISTDL